jgi:hypothetical protein
MTVATVLVSLLAAAEAQAASAGPVTPPQWFLDDIEA